VIMLNISEMGKMSEDSSSQKAGLETYRRYISKMILECEFLLKVVGMSKSGDALLENFRLVWKDGSIEDLRDAMMLCGVKITAHQDILKRARAAGIPGKEPESSNVIPVVVPPITSKFGLGRATTPQNIFEMGLSHAKEGVKNLTKKTT